MEYKHYISEKLTDVYDVSYDEDIFYEVLEELKKYKYVKIEKGYINESNASEKRSSVTKSQIIERINKMHRISGFNCMVDTIKKSETEKDCYEYLYSYNEYPKLYWLIDSALTGRDILNSSCEFVCEEEKSSIFCDIAQKEQLMVEHVLSCANSLNLNNLYEKMLQVEENLELILLEKEINKDFDYVGLFRLYTKVLSTLKFRLIKQVRNVNDDLLTNGLDFVQRKLIKK